MDEKKVSETTTNSKRWQINTKLVPMKIHFFLFFGSFAGLGPALILFCQKIGMSYGMIGTMYAVLPFIQFLSKPLTGSFADKFQKHKATFMASIVLMTVSIFSINFMPLPDNNLNAGQNIIWLPHNESVVECPPAESWNANTEMRLTVCESNHKNNSMSSTQLLAHSTVFCRLSCDHSKQNLISSLYCDNDNPNCLSYDTNYRLDTISLLVATSPVSNNVSQSLDTRGNNDFACSTLSIKNMSLGTNGTDKLQYLVRNLTITSCTKHDEVRFGCLAVCTANRNVLKSGEHRDLKLQFMWIWIANMIAWCAYGTLMSTSDSILLHLLGENSKEFGMTRLFGSVGWGLMAPIIGYIIDKVSEGLPEKNYSPGFYMFAGFMLVDFLVNIPTKVNVQDKSKEIFKDVISVFRNPEVVVLALAVFCNGITTGFLWTFLVVYANELNSTQLIIGLNYAVECFLSEIPLFIVSGWIVEKLGHSNSMSLSMLSCGIKCVLYSFINDAWYMLPIALMHGVTYGLLYSSMATYILTVAPPGTIATLQGVFQGLFEGIGVGVGNFIGGIAYENLGGKQAFMVIGVATMAASVLHYVSSCILSKFRPTTESVTA